MSEVKSSNARRRERRHCVWCPRDVKGSLEVFVDGTWRPVCAYDRARRNQSTRTLAEIEVGKITPSEPGKIQA